MITPEMREAQDPVPRPGPTRWRLVHAFRVAVIIDAAAYYAHLKAAIVRARHSILLIGWAFDPRVELERGAEGRFVPGRQHAPRFYR